MPQLYHVRITVRASRELRGIRSYVEKSSPQGAANPIRTIVDAIFKLDTFPHGHPVRPGQRATARAYRSMPVGNYVVRYRIDEPTRTVFVTRIRHGARLDP